MNRKYVDKISTNTLFGTTDFYTLLDFYKYSLSTSGIPQNKRLVDVKSDITQAFPSSILQPTRNLPLVS
jgi:hypothetical protein